MQPQVPTFNIGKIPIYGDLVLAPMEGFSDLPFRSLCRDFGSAISYTDFINAQELLAGIRRAVKKLDFYASERPVGIQIYDSEVDRLLDAARLIRLKDPDFIDINMGCSARSISGRGAGAGLLRDPGKVFRIFCELSSQLDIPITGKIRLGWDEGLLNYQEIALAIQNGGGSLIAVHGRTRAQKYSGRANWDAIAEIKSMVDIPVIGNGDVRSVADIDQIAAHTCCDAVMIGRGAMGNPWIFQRKPRARVPVDEVLRVITSHLEKMCQYYGESRGVILFRKHLARYLKPYPLRRELRRALLTDPEGSSLMGTLRTLFLQQPHVFRNEQEFIPISDTSRA